MNVRPNSRRILLVCVLGLAAVAAPLGSATAARADGPLSGPVYFCNLTDCPLKLEAVTYVDPAGREVAVSTTFAVEPRQSGYVAIDAAKVTAREFRCRLVSGDGATNIRWKADSLDADGDFVLVFGDADLREHRRLLGKAPTPAPTYASPAKVAARGPTDEEIGRGIAKIIAAAVANAIAQDRVDNGEGGLPDAFVIEVARKARDEAVQSALGDLFPSLSAQEAATTRRLICLCLDGELTVDRYNEQAAKERLIARLRR